MAKENVHESQRNKEDLVTREEAALRLGFHVNEVRRRERLGQLRPVKRGPHNSFLYRASDVKELAGLIAAQRGDYKPEHAQSVFKLLQEGKTPVDCVILTGVDPQAVEALTNQFAILNKGLHIPAETLKKINALPIDGPLPIETADDLLTFFTDHEKASCLECAKKPREFCKSCVQDAIKSARSKAVAEASGTDEL